MLTEKSSKVVKKFYCETCDYNCCRKYDFDKHLSTRKHKMLINANISIPESDKIHFCECGKSYKQMPSLSRHKKTCTFINEETENNNGVNNEKLVEKLLEDNAEMRSLIKEIIPKIGNSTNNSNNNTNCNNEFNMNFFLNETCKDAMPLLEFINNLKLSVEDLDNTGKEGLVKGLTDIITKGLNELDITKRPIHCSDIKRETLYIKDEDKWIKDDKDKSMVSHAIRKVKRDADRFFPKWLEQHPNCWEQESPYHEQYMTMVTNRFGKGEENFQEKNTKKVIKNIAKEVIVDKENE